MLKLIEFVLLAMLQMPPAQECYEVKFKDCEKPVPCADKTCIVVGQNFVPFDMNLDGTIGPHEGYDEPIRKCKLDPTTGHTGTYANDQTSWGDSIVVARDQSLRPKPGGKTERSNTIFCFKKKGCPINDCTEHADVNNPAQTVFFCSNPSQSGVDDDPHTNKWLEESCELVAETPIE